MDDTSALSPQTLIAAASEKLGESGYKVVREQLHASLPVERAFVAEDQYAVVGVVASADWDQLESEWGEAQGALVEILSRRLTRADPKAWDGYLVLLCSGDPPEAGRVAAIERDTSRVRKLVAPGSELRTVGDVGRVLAPLLPLNAEAGMSKFADVLTLLPELLGDEVPPSATRAVVDAFRNLEPPLDRLHERLHGQ